VTTLIHQLEIRYTTIINFSSIIKDIIGPFIKLTDNVSIANENSFKEKITLNFDSGLYTIIISSNLLLLKYEGDTETLKTSNSIIENPYLGIYGRLKSSQYFGRIVNTLFYAFNVSVDPNNKLSDVVKKSSIDGLNPYILEINKEISDVGVILEMEKKDKSLTRINLGPYKGYADLEKRNLSINNTENEEIINDYGFAFEYTLLSYLNDFSFSDYKKMQLEFINTSKKYEKFL